MTEVLLKVGFEDLLPILEAVAISMPESAEALSSCAVTAVRQNAETLSKAQAREKDLIFSVQKAAEELEVVRDFIQEQNFRAADDDNERELTAEKHIDDALRLLKTSA